MSRRLKAPSPALIIALISLFVSIGGVGYAASKIGTDDLANGAVTKKKLHRKAVATRKIKKEAVKTGKLADAAATTNKLADAAVTNGKLAAGAVHASQLGPIETVDVIEPIPANGTKNLSVTCPPGTTLINGGGTATTFAVHMAGSLAFQEVDAWSAAWENTGNTQQNVRVVANCLSE